MGGVILHGLDLGVGRYLLLLAVAVLGAAVFLANGQTLVGFVKGTAAINAVGRLLFTIFVLLGLVGGRASWAAWAGNDSNALTACAGYIAVSTFIGIRWFRWEAHWPWRSLAGTANSRPARAACLVGVAVSGVRRVLREHP